MALLDGGAVRHADLMADVLASLNSGELAQRRFREIARVAGLVFGGYPGAPKSLRQLQASSSLFYEVFRKYDAGNRLLGQAEPKCWRRSWTSAPARHAAAHGRRCRWNGRAARAQPFALPLMVERLREQLSTEKLKDRLDRLLAECRC
jgi:ATP-dependent Lhr-like helicase